MIAHGAEAFRSRYRMPLTYLTFHPCICWAVTLKIAAFGVTAFVMQRMERAPPWWRELQRA